MLIYALIPARSGSKGIKNKNIKLVKKKYLINYTIEFSLKCKSIDRTFVSTDSEKIRNISLDTGSEVPFLRPKKISKFLTIICILEPHLQLDQTNKSKQL